MTTPLNYPWTVELLGQVHLVLRYTAPCNSQRTLERLAIRCRAEDFNRGERAMTNRALEYRYEDAEHRITLAWPPLEDTIPEPEITAERISEEGSWTVVDASVVRASLRLAKHILH